MEQFVTEEATENNMTREQGPLFGFVQMEHRL